MRLLNVHDLTFRTFASTDVPRYIVASHRWSIGEETTFKDVTKKRNTSRTGYKKVEDYVAFIRQNIDGVDWLWIDTCCVNQDSSQEVSEAINSMFRWYSDAELCIAHLVDVVTVRDLHEFRRSSWFRRGWTLQELIAPESIIFVTRDWQVLGHKGDGRSASRKADSIVGPPLEAILAEITRIPENILRNRWQTNVVDAQDIFRWSAHRETTKAEDLAYCLLGLFDVSMPVIYGEGEGKARERLIAEISKPATPKRMLLTGETSSVTDAGSLSPNTGVWGGKKFNRNGSSTGSDDAGDDGAVEQHPPTGTPPVYDHVVIKVLTPSSNRSGAGQGCIACRTVGTCQWFLDRPEIATWLQSPRRGGTLWLHAPPGFGKSITFAALAEHLQQDHSEVILTHFCSATDDTLRAPTNILRNCLTQAILRRRDFFQVVAESKQRSEAPVATQTELERLLSTMAKVEPGLVIMVDGYDECFDFESDYHRRCGRNRADLLRKIRALVSDTPSRLIIASRDEEDIRSALCNSEDPLAKTAIVEYRIKALDVQDDVRHFTEQQVRAFKSLRDRPADLQLEITRTLTENSGGMFLWVRLQSMQLAEARNIASLRKQISRKPQGLDDFYEKDWQRIQNNERSERDRSLLILRWVTLAVRPLSSRELFEAIAIEFDGSDFALSEESLPDRVITDELVRSELLEPCKPFLALQESERGDGANDSSHVVQVAHFSMKTFLLEKFTGRSVSSSPSVQDAILARACVGYLAAGLGWAELDVPDAGLRSHPLLLYAAQNWMIHLNVNHSSHQDALQAAGILFDRQNPHWAKWRDLFESIIEVQDVAYVAKGLDMKFVTVGAGSRTYYAALFGLRDALKQNVGATPTDVNAIGGRYGTPLQAACVKGHAELASFLLSAGADANICSGLWGSAMNAAAVAGETATINSLLEQRIDFSLTDGFGRHALYLAVRANHPGVVKILIEKGVTTLETTNTNGWTPINVACSGGHIEVVKLLLEKKVNLETANSDGLTPIVAASDEGHAEVVKLLLEKKVNLATATSNGWTPILAASNRGHTEVVKLLLLEKNVGLETTNKNGRTPIHAASSNGHTDVVKLLLEKDVNLETTDNDGWTPINSASSHGHTEVVKLLLDKVDLEMTDNAGWTPINAASNNGHIEIVKLLLERKVNLETAHGIGYTPLYAAAGRGYDKIVDVLLKAGAGYTAQGKNGWTPINAASKYGYTEVVKLLLAKHVDLEMPNSQGWTPINAASSNGHFEIVKLLLAEKVNLETVTNSGQTPLYSAASHGHDKIVDVLLKAGADYTAQNNNGWTPINAASYHGHTEVVKLLLERNVDLDIASNKGWTPMKGALEKGHSEVVKLLIGKNIELETADSHGKTLIDSA